MPDSNEPTGTECDDRTDRIQQVLNDCVLRRANGEVISDESLIASHPELCPELAQGLRNLRIIEAARQQLRATEGRGLQIRCPHCRNSLEIVDDATLSNVACPSCGSHFSLVDEAERSFQANRHQPINHFQLLEKVGAGAFGSVWSAKDTQLDRIVARKLPRKGQMTPEDTEGFIREARAAAQLNHPNIVRVLEVGRHEDRLYIACDFVQGPDLADWLTEQQPSPPEAAELCATVADALQHAHEQGIIHRDMKPSNIMLDSSGGPHITDFGLAKREAGEITMTVEGKILGTPAYMSPEQARGTAHDADARSDVYSLGVILFELLTGERPFRGSTRMLLHQVLVEDAPSTRKLNQAVPRDLDNICLRCLEKDPGGRYQTAGEMRDDLTRFLAGGPVHARPIARTARAWRWCKRKPLVAALCAAVASLLVILGIGGPMVALHQRALAERETSARRDAQAARVQAELESARRQRLLYASDMLRAESDWLTGDVDAVLELLERHYPKAGQDDLRGFEWYHLWRKCGRSVMVPTVNPEGRVHDVLFSSDGKSVTTVTSSVRSSRSFVVVQKWSTFTRSKQSEHSVPLQGITVQALSPDGSLAATGRIGGMVTLLNLATKDSRDFGGLAFDVESITFSPDTRLLAASDTRGAVKVWKVADGLELAPIESHKDTVNCLAFSPNGRILASGSRGDKRMVKLSNVETGELLRELDYTRLGNAWSLAFSPDGKLVATGAGGSSPVIVWAVETAERILELPGHTGIVTCVVFSQDGRILATAGQDQTVRLWNVATGEQTESLRGNSGWPRGLAFSPDGAILGCPDNQGRVKLWPLGEQTGTTNLEGHKDFVICKFSPDGKTLVSRSNDKTVLWDVATRTERVPVVGHGGSISSVAFSPTGEILATGSSDKTVKLWYVSTGELLDTLDHDRSVGRVAFSPDGRLLATVLRRETLTIWDVASRELVSRVEASADHMVSSLAFSPDGETLVTASIELLSGGKIHGTVKLWDIPSLELKGTIPCKYPVSRLVYSADGEYLALGTRGGVIELRDVEHYRVFRTFYHGYVVVGITFPQDGKTMISTAGVGGIRFWDIASGNLRFKLTAHHSGTNSADLSSDGRVLATGGGYGELKLWHSATDEEVELMRQRWLKDKE